MKKNYKINSFFKNKLKIKTLAGKISAIFWLLMATLVIIFGIIMGYYFKTTTRHSLTDMLSMVIEGNAKNFDELISKIDTTTGIFQDSDSQILTYLNTEGDFIKQMNTYKRLESYMNKTINTTLASSEEYCGTDFFVNSSLPLSKVFVDNSDIVFSTDAYYYSPIVLSNSESVSNMQWYKETDSKNGSNYWFKSPEIPNVLCDAKTLYIYESEHDKYEKIGVFLTNIDISWMVKNLNTSKLTDGTVIALVDWNNKTIYADKATDIGNGSANIIDDGIADKITDNGKEIINNGKKYLAYKHQLSEGLNFITLVPVNDLNKILIKQLLILLIIAVMIMTIGSFAIYYFANIAVAPIKKLANHMSNNKNLRMIDNSGILTEETQSIYNNYNQFVEQISDLIEQIYESTQQEKSAQIKALQAQINPHFVYNTLDTICCISLVRDQQDIAQILSQLAGMMRYNTKNPEAMVAVKNELELIYNFKNIQAFRDNGGIEITDNADEIVKNMKIPKMIIQPLVENSVFYGVNENGKVNVNIDFAYDDRQLVIKVWDTGTGGDADEINEHLNYKINISKNNSGLGIRNVNERIILNYGKEYGLHFEKLGDGRIVAVINVPRIDS